METVGILGGTFNPIHYGHLILAQSALEQYSLDRVLFMPSGCSYMKEEVLDAKMRYEMTKLAISDNPLFEISRMEVDRPGNSYTCDTLSELKKRNPEIRYEYIIGADTLFSMEKWERPEQIFSACGILCAVRDGYGTDEMHVKQQELEQKYHARIRFLKENAFDISSTEIRERVREKRTVAYYLPETVIAYIQSHHLYENG